MVLMLNLPQLLHPQSSWDFLREAIGEKSGLTMDFFRKGSDPPPLIFVSYGTREAHLSFGHQKGEKHNFPKTPKIPMFKII